MYCKLTEVSRKGYGLPILYLYMGVALLGQIEYLQLGF